MAVKQARKAKVGLALGAGGARGVAHIGVLKVLAQEGIELSAIAGSGFGALVGALFAKKQDIASLEKALMDSPDWGDVVKLLLNFSYTGAATNGRQLATFIDDQFGKMRFSNLDIPFAAVATNLRSGEKEVFDSGYIAKALQASIAIPFVFPPVAIGNQLFVDGGAVEPVPVPTIKEMQCDIIVSVNLDGKELDRFDGSPEAPFEVMQQTIKIFHHRLSSFTTRYSDIRVEPNADLKNTADWDGRERIQNLIKSGEQAMRAQLQKLKVKMLYWEEH